MSDEEKKRDDPYALKDIFTEMEMELVQSLQRNLSKHKLDEINAGFSWEMWQKAMIRNIQRYRNEIKHIIDGYRPAVQDAISETLQGTYDKAAEQAQKTMEQAQIKLDAGSFSFPEDGKNTGRVGETPPEETQFFDINRKKMDALIKSTTNDFEDANHAIYRKMDDVYRQTIFKAEFQLSSGAISLDAAIDKATESFLAKGIDCIVYKNGNHVNIATYAEMALRTASQRAKFLADGSKRDEFGRHLVFVSAHFNSCRLCLPWQGKVLIDDVFSHPSNDYKAKYKGQYKLLSQAIKAGLMHPNCRHTIANYFEGITKLPEVPDDDTALQNYEAEQKQRKLENAIRKAKRKAAGAVNIKNEQDAVEDVKKLQKELREHLKENKQLRRHSHREKIYELNKISSVVSEVEKGAIKRYVSPDAYDLNYKLRNNLALTETETEWVKNLDSLLDKMPEYKGTVSRSLHFMFPEDFEVFVDSHEIGAIKKYNQYISSTCGEVYNSDGQVQMIIDSKHGKDVRFYNEKEQEILFKRDAEFIVLAKKIIDSTVYFWLKEN